MCYYSSHIHLITIFIESALFVWLPNITSDVISKTPEQNALWQCTRLPPRRPNVKKGRSLATRDYIKPKNSRRWDGSMIVFSEFIVNPRHGPWPSPWSLPLGECRLCIPPTVSPAHVRELLSASGSW